MVLILYSISQFFLKKIESQKTQLIYYQLINNHVDTANKKTEQNELNWLNILKFISKCHRT